MGDTVARARAHALDDVDLAARDELLALVSRTEAGDLDARAELEDRFSGPLEFGTAGIRGLLGAGESRMNRSVAIRAVAGLAKHLFDVDARAATRGVVIARDGRHMSAEFAADAAEVCLARGLRVHWIEGATPTPLLAFSVKALDATAGIMFTASHNPPAYNGLKVYWDGGAQIVPPVDALIACEISGAPPARLVPRLSRESVEARSLFTDVSSIREEYLRALMTLAVVDALKTDDLTVAYSAMHGVGEPLFLEAMHRRGFSRIYSVPEQAVPDGDFPTLPFPNPEEPGAMDMVLALARKYDCDLALVHDPDADRLGAAAYDASTRSFRVLDGNEIGVLLADHLFRNDAGGERLVVSTIVSSRLLQRMAKETGVQYAETLTGFKWIASEAERLSALEPMRFVLGYEEALGYTVGPIVHDKDGIGAAIVLAEMAADEKARGATLIDALRRIRKRYGYFMGRHRSVVLTGRDGRRAIQTAMARLRTERPSSFGEEAIASTWDVASGYRLSSQGERQDARRMPGDVLVFDLEDGGRVAVRPSGTEPKLKLYFEVVETWAEGEDPESVEARASGRLDRLVGAVLRAAGLLDEPRLESR